MELFGNSKRDWKGEYLEAYFNTKRSVRSRTGIIPGGQRRLEDMNEIKYCSGLFNENELIKLCQSNNKTMIQITYVPSNSDFTDMFKNNLKEMKNQIVKYKKKYLRDEKNRGFKIKLHTRHNYTIGAQTLIIWKSK